jgi:hypothetical protein
MIENWVQCADRRSIFLNCYKLMTLSMLEALETGEFQDPGWVGGLLERFAEYYFVASQAYEEGRAEVPRVWRVAYDAARNPDTMVLQNVLLGINAHINYDLVLTLVDVLEPEKSQLDSLRREFRYQDHAQVNHAIALTVNSVQDQVLEPQAPILDLVDKLLGPLDEWTISRLIAGWRDAVWEYALQVIDAATPELRQVVIQRVEASAMQWANRIMLKELWTPKAGEEQDYAP